MDDKTYNRMSWGCSCGHVARSAIAEARHRHNFPLLCRKPKVPKLSETQQACLKASAAEGGYTLYTPGQLRTVRTLQRRGLVKWEPMDTRYGVVTITEEGRKVLALL